MTLSETAWWYLGNIMEYCVQMFPCMLVGVVGYLFLKPFRRKRLQGKMLVSSFARELALLLFLMFCAGLISLTLFPANFWSYVTDWLFFHERWAIAWGHENLGNFYPSWEQVMGEIPSLPEMLKPFQEIRRALNRMSPWLMFMLLSTTSEALDIFSATSAPKETMVSGSSTYMVLAMSSTSLEFTIVLLSCSFSLTILNG